MIKEVNSFTCNIREKDQEDPYQSPSPQGKTRFWWFASIFISYLILEFANYKLTMLCKEDLFYNCVAFGRFWKSDQEGLEMILSAGIVFDLKLIAVLKMITFLISLVFTLVLLVDMAYTLPQLQMGFRRLKRLQFKVRESDCALAICFLLLFSIVLLGIVYITVRIMFKVTEDVNQLSKGIAECNIIQPSYMNSNNY